MATDVKKIVENLLSFYPFDGKAIVSVGAGGGQLIEYGRNAQRVMAVDCDQEALHRLGESLSKAGLAHKFELIHSDFCGTNVTGDTVLFEFCLHEMNGSKAAVAHAQGLCSDVVIADHWIDSEWAYLVSEDEKVAESWAELEPVGFRKFQVYSGTQIFSDYEELYQRVKGQGEQTVKRIEPFEGQKNITIPMRYALALI